MAQKDKKSALLFIAFPGIAMLLGWGLRGYIGGGPFGAMIPGAFVALCLAMLFRLPVKETSILVVFGAVGIGLGGEMTYGQTLGFLKSPETVWWGTLGTTVKGAVWGLLGGIILALGLVRKNLQKKTIIYALLVLLAGMLAGFKLVNQPMLIYFSDPAKPRPESWAALLLGAISVFVYLKYKLQNQDFRIISRFALWGLIGGGLGFGIGGFWMVLGFSLPQDVTFNNWWKMMEFTFGLLLGTGLGIGAWRSRKEITELSTKWNSEEKFNSGHLWKDFLFIFLLAFVIFWLMPNYLDPIVDKGYTQGSFTMLNAVDLAKILSNYAFYGFLMILAILYYPKAAWQAGITLTFCYIAIDLMQDVLPDADTSSLFTLYFLTVFLMNLIVASLVAWIQRRGKLIINMFLLIVWSCMVVAFIRLTLNPEVFSFNQVSFCELICGRFFVHLVFLSSAILITWISLKRIPSSE